MKKDTQKTRRASGNDEGEAGDSGIHTKTGEA